MKHSNNTLLLVITVFLLLSGTNIIAQTSEQKNVAQLPATIASTKSTASLFQNDGRCYYNITELNTGMGLGSRNTSYSSSFVGVTSMVGYAWNSSLMTGIGTGISAYYSGFFHIPLFADLRYLIGGKESKPFLALQGGLLLSDDQDVPHSRDYLNPSLGYLIPLKTHTALTVSAGIFNQWIMHVKDRRDTFFNVKVGLMFK